MLPADIKVCIVADRGFGDHKLYRALTEELKFDYVIRFRGHITVTSAAAERAPPLPHPQHVDAAGRDEPLHQKSREEKKSNIEPRRVIPRSGIAWCGSQATATVTRTMSSAKRQKNLISLRVLPWRGRR